MWTSGSRRGARGRHALVPPTLRPTDLRDGHTPADSREEGLHDYKRGKQGAANGYLEVLAAPPTREAGALPSPGGCSLAQDKRLRGADRAGTGGGRDCT